METTVLLALRPPSNIERTLAGFQQTLFRARGSVSALAFAPMVPLCYVASPPDPPEGRTLPHGIGISTRDWALVDDVLMLAVEPADRIEELTRTLTGRRTGDEVGSGPIPPFAGLYIASFQEPGSPARWPGAESMEEHVGESVIETLGPPPRASWSTSDVVCWVLRFADRKRWWAEVHWTEMWRARLRKGSVRAD